MSSSRQVLGKVLILGSQPLQPVAGIKPELSSWHGEHILAQVSGSFFAFYCIVRILNSSSNYLSTNCFYANFKFSQAKARDNFVAPWSLPDLASGQSWVSRVRFPLGLQGWRLHFSQSWCKGRNVDLSSKLDGLIRPDFNQKHCRFSSELNNKWQIS